MQYAGWNLAGTIYSRGCVVGKSVYGQCAQFCTCTSLISRAMVFGLGMRLHVHMRTRLENGILHNEQQSGQRRLEASN